MSYFLMLFLFCLLCLSVCNFSCVICRDRIGCLDPIAGYLNILDMIAVHRNCAGGGGGKNMFRRFLFTFDDELALLVG
jgi:hypothetical protein